MVCRIMCTSALDSIKLPFTHERSQMLNDALTEKIVIGMSFQGKNVLQPSSTLEVLLMPAIFLGTFPKSSH